MTTAEILSTILGIEGATMARANKTNFIVIPTDEGYTKVNVTKANMEGNKAHPGFNAEAAVAEFKAWEAQGALREAERANKPAKVKGPNPEAQARRDELDKAITEMPSFVEMTATDIANTVKVSYAVNPMLVGLAAKRLIAKGILTVSTRENDKKPYYTKG